MGKQQTFSPKLVIYGAGYVGQELTRLASRKGWEIVAAFNRKGDKIGQDLGRLARLDKDLGVIVQDCENADYDSIDADVVLNTSCDELDKNMPCYERFLSRGINVLCHGAQAYNPFWSNAELATKIDALAKQHRASFCGSGIWDMTRLWSGIIAAGPCVELNAIHHLTNTEALRAGLHWIPVIGVGMSVEEYDEKLGRKPGLFADNLAIPSITVLQHYGYTITNVQRRQAPVVWEDDVYCPYQKKEIAAGLAVGTCYISEIETAEGVTASTRASYRVFRDGEDEEMVWRVDGLPGMEVRVKREDSGVASASSLFNRIPDVIAAEPGIHTLMDMGPEKPSTLL